MNQNQKPPRGAAERTVDSVSSAIGMLWDWLGADTAKGEPEPSIFDLLPSGEETVRKLPTEKPVSDCAHEVSTNGVCNTCGVEWTTGDE
jgi:hypothetical protein